jgi:hypothetical protein
MADPQPDLLAPLAPPVEDVERPVGTFDGPEGWQDAVAAALARVRVWCGPLHGWRDVGELRGGTTTPIWVRGRLSVALIFDAGAAVLSRREVERDEPEESQS